VRSLEISSRQMLRFLFIPDDVQSRGGPARSRSCSSLIGPLIKIKFLPLVAKLW
jgi:hypothetical protein